MKGGQRKVGETMKIGIIGKGLAGIITALRWKAALPDIEIDMYHDKDTPIVPVGSGSWPSLLKLLIRTSGSTSAFYSAWGDHIHWQATPKLGIAYKGWGKHGDWVHPFSLVNTAMHFDPQEFTDYFCNIGLVNLIEKRIDSYDQVDARYVYDCSGFPDNYDDYHTLRNPLNKVMLSNLPPTTDYYTGTVATPDGWTFVIPLQNRTSLGYLYNDTITTDEQAEKNFREQFGVEEVGKPRSFRNYLAKNPIIDDRVILNGNKLTFIEPLEATSITTYDFFAEHTMTAIMKNGSNIPQELQNAVFRNAEMVYQNMNFILYHYQFGSKYDTPFWDYAKTLVPNDPKLYEWLRRGERFKWKEFMDENYSYYKVSSLYLMHHKLSGDDWEELFKSNWKHNS